jgi:hypothetical protein
MRPFKALFGVDEQEIKKRCILMPFIIPPIIKEFQVEKWSPGKLYKVAQADHFTLIHTRMGAGLVGDVVLYLKETACEEVFLFGSCGLVTTSPGENFSSGNSLGKLFVPSLCYALESFSDFLLKESLLEHPERLPTFYPHPDLCQDFLKFAPSQILRPGVCATVSSLKLEEERLPLLQKAKIQAIDMECSAFFAAAQARQIKALALFWVSDIVKQQPFYATFTTEETNRINAALLKAGQLLKAYCSTKY